MGRKTLSCSFKNVIAQYPDIPKRIRYLCIRCLLVFFLAISYCILGAVLFKFIEGDQEAEYKCGKFAKLTNLLDTILSNLNLLTKTLICTLTYLLKF